jgi:hypothetical protein
MASALTVRAICGVFGCPGPASTVRTLCSQPTLTVRTVFPVVFGPKKR